MAGPSPRKARKILRHGSVRGKPLTPRARRYMGAVASGTAKENANTRKGPKKRLRKRGVY